eukprot:TRINITY_DN854_c0_g1_i1.p1 TRINITY_DN854_c0_g1~~TRINITY_DN854_c0_g1_i1.p1  ORF type:complete len:414 (-),score=94.26 TRINITY_DN854_c0_g1_i1:1198-2439(-)
MKGGRKRVVNVFLRFLLLFALLIVLLAGVIWQSWWIAARQVDKAPGELTAVVRAVQEEEVTNPENHDGQQLLKFVISDFEYLANGERAYMLGHHDVQCQTIWTKIMMQALLQHPQRTTDINEADVVFADFEEAFEINWPDYGGVHSNWINGWFNHSSCEYFPCTKIQRLLHDPRYSKLKFVTWDLMGSGDPDRCGLLGDRVITACYSCVEGRFKHGRDIGIAPNAIVPFEVSLEQVKERCRNSKYLFTFKGAGRDQGTGLRRRVADLHNGADMILLIDDEQRAGGTTRMNDSKVVEYAELMENTQFGAVMRGDDSFSFRFTEVLSAGVIPVIYSDGLVLPFEEFINWDEVAVRIPESQVHLTESILRSFSLDEICSRRERAWHIYQQHLLTIGKQIDAILKIIQQRKTGHGAN